MFGHHLLSLWVPRALGVCPGVQLLVPLGTTRPSETGSQAGLENPGQGALAAPPSPASAPHGSYRPRQPQETGAGAPRQEPQAPGPGTGKLPARPSTLSAELVHPWAAHCPFSLFRCPADHPHLACSIPLSHPYSRHSPLPGEPGPRQPGHRGHLLVGKANSAAPESLGL